MPIKLTENQYVILYSKTVYLKVCYVPTLSSLYSNSLYIYISELHGNSRYNFTYFIYRDIYIHIFFFAI